MLKILNLNAINALKKVSFRQNTQERLLFKLKMHLNLFFKKVIFEFFHSSLLKSIKQNTEKKNITILLWNNKILNFATKIISILVIFT